MKIHILGIGGTFMAGLARLARQAGHQVSGTDLVLYPPMSTQLQALDIQVFVGYEATNMPLDIDCVVVGNVISRGNPLMEYVLDNDIPYISGPQWLAENILKAKHVLAVSGTHGKTTTSSMLAWVLEYAGLKPGFLIGGVPENFGVSAKIGESDLFVIEADEYDAAFFDKRSKFLHYHPKTLILNNLEFDHADIFPDLVSIQKQFSYLLRTVPSNGLVIHPAQDENVGGVLQQGCWAHTTTFGEQGEWTAQLLSRDGAEFEVYYRGSLQGLVKWDLLGLHNVNNALATLAAATHVGTDIKKSLAALSYFKNVKRRMEIKGQINGMTLYDDFAHHPTAIATTLAGLRARVGDERIIVVLEFGSYTMRAGVHKDHIQSALVAADKVLIKKPENVLWSLESMVADFQVPTNCYDTVDELVVALSAILQVGDHVIVMSNSGFGGIHQKLLTAFEQVGGVVDESS